MPSTTTVVTTPDEDMAGSFLQPPMVVEALLGTLPAYFVTLADIDRRLTDMAGTAAQRVKDATLAVALAEVISDVNPCYVNSSDDSNYFGIVLNDPMSAPFHFVAVVQSEIDRLTQLRSDLVQECDSAVKIYLTAKHDDTHDNAAALLVERSAVVEMISAIGKASGCIVHFPETPKVKGATAKSAKSSGSTSTRVHSKTSHYYTMQDGKPFYRSDDGLGCLCYHTFGIPTKDLEKLITAAGVSNLLDPWEVTITAVGTNPANGKKFGKSHTATIGHSVS